MGQYCDALMYCNTLWFNMHVYNYERDLQVILFSLLQQPTLIGQCLLSASH